MHKLKEVYTKLFSLPAYLQQKKYIYLVYTLGKVGSSTIYEMLKKKFPYNDIFHVHFLSNYYLKELLPQTNHAWNISHGEKIRDHLDNHSDKRIKVITLVREPISRMVSNFFENYFDYIPGKPEDYCAKQLADVIIENSDHKYVFNWFDDEFKSYTGIDVYSFPFNKEQGYSHYEVSDRFDLTVIKLEKLDQCYQLALNKATGNIFKNLSKKNVKSQSELYQEVKQSIRFREEELKEIYTSKYMKHFYTDQEIAGFIQKWSTK